MKYRQMDGGEPVAKIVAELWLTRDQMALLRRIARIRGENLKDVANGMLSEGYTDLMARLEDELSYEQEDL